MDAFKHMPCLGCMAFRASGQLAASLNGPLNFNAPPPDVHQSVRQKDRAVVVPHDEVEGLPDAKAVIGLRQRNEAMFRAARKDPVTNTHANARRRTTRRKALAHAFNRI